MVQNKSLIFKNVPSGWPVPGQDLAVEAREFDLDAAAPEDGLTVQLHYASFDPYQRGRMRPADAESYFPPFTLGQPMSNAAIATVLKSNISKFSKGDLVIGLLPIEEYARISGDQLKIVRKLENPYNLDPKIYLGALGMPGLTAYSSLYEIGHPKKGETIFISAASGAVGQIVGQLAKHEGLTVIGSVGSDEKLEFIEKELGFDKGFNYKKESASDALKRLAPNGIDIYYENVGGEQLDAALQAMNGRGRIIACGMISQYNKKPEELYGVKNLMLVVRQRLTIRGFIVSDEDMGPKYTKDHQANVGKWIHDGSFKQKMSITEGIDNAVDGFLGMLKGDNFGKAVLTIKELDS